MNDSGQIQIARDDTTGTHSLTASAMLPASRTALFNFFSDAFRLEQITPPWLRFRVLTPPPITIQSGTLIDYRLTLRMIPIRWRTEISSWDPPNSFTDRQLKGPYLLWEHNHTFEEFEEGTRVTDHVRYKVPGGRIVHAMVVKNDLLRIFEYRQQKMLELFSPEPGGTTQAENRG